MIRLAARVTVAGGRESAVRLVLTTLGVALGTALLLYATVAFPALHAHDVRAAWTTTGEHNERPAQDAATTDPLLWRLRADRFEDRDVLRLDVAAEGPRAPVPEWLDHLPGPGELAASPALANLLRTTDPALLADRYPGTVTEAVGRQGLQSSDQLVVVVGRTADALRAEGGAITVRSIETRPVQHSFTQFLRIVLLIGALGLLVPVVVFVTTATRLAAARRERRLAAMRLAGATPGQADVVAAVEAALAAVAGTALGFGLFAATRSWAAGIPVDGHAFYPSDLRLAVGWAAMVAVGVPVLAVAAAIVSVRRTHVSPLGITRQAVRRRPTARRVGVLAGGIVLFTASLVESQRGGDAITVAQQVAIGAGFCLVVLGIVACGPWLTTVVARAMARVGQRAPTLLAARRLEDDPAAGFRAISGLILAVFVASFVAAVAASSTAAAGWRRPAITARTVGVASTAEARTPDGAPLPTAGPRPIGAAPATALLADLRATTGVERVVDIRELPLGTGVVSPEPGRPAPPAGVLRCSDAEALRLQPCAGTTAVATDIELANASPLQLPTTAPVPVAALDGQPLLGVAVVTDGGAATIERVRTTLEAAYPGATAVTGADLDAEQNWQVHDIARLSNVALVLTLLIAGCSLAVSVAGGLVERKRPFALLRLAGMPLRQLHRVVLAEAAAPLLVVAAASVALGFAVDAILLLVIGGQPFHLPAVGYWAALVGGLAFALATVGATLPLLDRLTSLETARFE